MVVRVLHPLVQQSEKVDTGSVRTSKALVPPSAYTPTLTVSLYRTRRPVVDHRIHKDTPRTVVADTDEEAGTNSWVPRRDRVAELVIRMPGVGKPARDRAVTIKLAFEATNLHVKVDPVNPRVATPEDIAYLRRLEAVIKYIGEEDVGLAAGATLAGSAAAGGAGARSA